MYQKVLGKLIEPQPSNVTPWKSGTFKLLEFIEGELVIPAVVEPPDFTSTYVLTSWDTNAYIKIREDLTIEVEELHGADLTTDKEYILIRTRY